MIKAFSLCHFFGRLEVSILGFSKSHPVQWEESEGEESGVR